MTDKGTTETGYVGDLARSRRVVQGGDLAHRSSASDDVSVVRLGRTFCWATVLSWRGDAPQPTSWRVHWKAKMDAIPATECHPVSLSTSTLYISAIQKKILRAS